EYYNMKGGYSMPLLYLSPSTQEFNPYITTGDEEYWMNQLADRMEPYLLANGIDFVRNDPSGNAATSIRQSNMGSYDFHLALHSNAAPDSLSGKLRGIDAYYYPTSLDGARMADLMVENLKSVYPLPDKIQTRPSTIIGEVGKTRAPSVLMEYGYHDNQEDADWLVANLDSVAEATVRAVTEYFGLPFLQPQAPKSAIVTIQDGNLNLRGGPGTAFPIVAKLPNGAIVQILNQFSGWNVVEYEDFVGYADSKYLMINN
ncbi:MAG: N-acetylmuramoyl-L-alanine amidase, partial [Eubacteriales bacterium]